MEINSAQHSQCDSACVSIREDQEIKLKRRQHSHESKYFFFFNMNPFLK